MLAQLISLAEGPSILLDKPILLIGRDPECDIQIDSRKISRRHCCIAQVNDYLVVRDLGSTNGIRINGMRVQEGILKASDELTIGGNLYRLSWDAQHDPAEGNHERELEAAGDQPFAADEDLLLEACDEPVALPDGSRPIHQLKSIKSASVTNKREGHSPRVEGKTPQEIVAPESLQRLMAAERTVPPIIPDNISLSPPSDSELRVAKRSQ